MKRNQIPVLPDYYLVRDRLCVRLDEAADVIFLSGREGCGKTSLLAQYCREREAAVFWHTFEKEDNEEGYFCRHFSYELASGRAEASAKRVGAGDYKKGEEPYGFRDCCSVDAGTRGYDVLLELPEDEEVSCIVFDQVHRITNNCLLYAIRRLLESNAGRKKIALSSAELPAPCFAKYFASGRYVMLTDQELCFSKEELLQLTRIYFPSAHLADEAGYAFRMQQLTGGWPVAVSYLMRDLKDSGGSPEDVPALQEQDVLNHTMLYDFIDYEIYRCFPAKEKQLLIQAAAFQRLDAQLLRRCLGQGAEDGMLRRLRRKNLVCKTGAGNGLRSSAQYQPLLRQFLMAQLSQSRMAQLSVQAGSYYLQKSRFCR